MISTSGNECACGQPCGSDTRCHACALREHLGNAHARVAALEAERDAWKRRYEEVRVRGLGWQDRAAALEAALRPFVAEDAPGSESEVRGAFWRTIAVSREQHEAALLSLAARAGAAPRASGTVA